MLRAVARSSATRVPSLLRPSASSALAQRARGLCSDGEGVQVDMVCRMWSGKVKDDVTAHQLDCEFENWIDAVAEVEGCAGATRLLCKTEWDYKLILKFEDVGSLQDYMKDHHERIEAEHMPKLEALLVDGKFKQQNFVYDDIE